MATKVPTEILIKILNFHHLVRLKIYIYHYYSIESGSEKKALCIRTHISCMDVQARTLLIQNGYDLSSSPPQATFDYSLLRSLTLICDNTLNMDLYWGSNHDFLSYHWSTIRQFISLQEIYIEGCYGWHKSDCLPLASSFTQLTIFNNFKELRRFSFDCGGRGFDANELLCQMAENLSESFETIEIRMNYYDPWIFSAEEYFFEGWCRRKVGVRNKKLRGLRIEHLRHTPHDSHQE
ncbi:136_t:CDS:2 [Diversispora eburnea]|uniref:136_t:CDS:1 n=1 Tax=Diversispora eburnea TaxID=1213867 RepID=A0A9N8WK52_9GLOM|nr:136_t:CDS:2 [Diversispora eburnea]